MNWHEECVRIFEQRREHVAKGLPLRYRRLTRRQYNIVETMYRHGFEILWTGSGFQLTGGDTIWPQTMKRLVGEGLLEPAGELWQLSEIGRKWMAEGETQDGKVDAG